MALPTVTEVKSAVAGTYANSLNGGAPTGGYKVKIIGTNFSGAGQVTTGVKFGANPATSYKVESSTEIVAIAPASFTFAKGYVAGYVNVFVTTEAGTNAAEAANVFIYWPPQTIKLTPTGFTEVVPLGAIVGTGEEVVSYLRTAGAEGLKVPLLGDYSRAAFVTINTVGTEVTGTPKLVVKLETSHDGGKTWLASEAAVAGSEVATAVETIKTTKTQEKPLNGLTRANLEFGAAGGVAGTLSINARYANV